MKRMSKKGRAGARALRRYRRKKARIEICLDRPWLPSCLILCCAATGILAEEITGIWLLAAPVAAATCALCAAWVLGYVPGLPRFLKRKKKQKG